MSKTKVKSSMYSSFLSTERQHVSKRFFDDYKRNYEDIIEFATGKRMVKVANNKWQEKVTGKGDKTILAEFASFENPEKAIRDYVKKLMGRLVFLQFVQKKGWLGVPKGGKWGEGDREFLQHLFDRFTSQIPQTSRTSFIDDILEPLFADINTRRSGDVANAKLGKNILVPYLNGGLFEPDKANSTDSPLHFQLPIRHLEKLFAFFGSYNFTIDENDPTDAEVGVDPEMLSRIFENLLEDNKDKGAFYTPKLIVEYMCREALIAYLQTDTSPDGVAQTPAAPQRNDLIANFVKTHDVSVLIPELRAELLQKLRDVKICDPAIGSGAFPMGLLKELFACRAALGDPLAEHPAVLKREIIENNIYGVDIEKGAVDISRLRFWLALVVDEETPHALPNLDFKIMQGNSLLESFGGVPLDHVLEGGSAAMAQGVYKGGKKAGKKRSDYWQSAFAFNGQDAIKEIVRDKNALFSETDHEEKKSMIGRINKNVKAFISSKLDPDSPFQLQIPDGQNDQFFLWHTWFSEVFTRPGRAGFDIVIGNPPYVIVPSTDALKPYYDANYEVATGGKRNLYHLFFERGLLLCKHSGVLVYITPDTYFSGRGTIALREYFLKNAQIDHIVHFTERDKVFENVTQAVAIVAMKRGVAPTTFEIRTSKGVDLIDPSILTKDTGYLFKGFNSIVTTMKKQHRTFGDVCVGFKGDVNLGMKKEFFHDKKGPDMLPLVRGDQISSYVFNGSAEWCEKIAESRGDTHKERVVFQEVANAGLVHRVKGTILSNVILGDSVNYVYSSCKDVSNELILAVLNSKAVNYYFKFFNQTNHVPIGEFKKIPFPDDFGKYAGRLTDLVRQIFAIKRMDQEADTVALETQIDDTVFALYGLNDEDKKVILGSEEEEPKRRGKNNWLRILHMSSMRKVC